MEIIEFIDIGGIATKPPGMVAASDIHRSGLISAT
jgi:hypothetical protein